MTAPPPRRRLRFYRRLSAEQRREYDRSDDVRSLPLPADPALGRAADRVVAAVTAGDRSATTRAAQALVDAIVNRLVSRGRPPPLVKVLRTRPRRAASEFHGLYTVFKDGTSEIKVWMFTAALGQVVKPRTFLRTLLHEVCHHLDMVLLDLPSSLHTLGFHARESFLVRVLEGSGARIPGGRGRNQSPEPPARRVERRPPAMRSPARDASEKPAQLDLFARR